MRKAPYITRAARCDSTSPYITLHYITLHYMTVHYMTLHDITWHYMTLHYITLHYITWHYMTLHDITWRYITLHYITLHYITFHEDEDETRTLNIWIFTKKMLFWGHLRWVFLFEKENFLICKSKKSSATRLASSAQPGSPDFGLLNPKP